MQYHEIANIFPLIEGKDFSDLVDDIAKNGQIEPIWTYDNQIIDGRNRYRACVELGVVPQYREWNGEGSLVSFVVALNLNRRHLTASQKAAIAVDLLPYYEAEARERQSTHKEGDVYLVAKLPEGNGRARDQAATATGASPRYVSDAKRLSQESPEVFEKVKSGELSIPQAKERVNPHVSHNSGVSEWYTPEKYIQAAREVMGEIDLDPASCATANEVVKAKRFFTVEEDGLKQPWSGKVWMNPPYSMPLISRFADKLVDHVMLGDVSEAVILVNNATETGWFQTMIDVAAAVCFPQGRVRFWHPDREAAPLQGQAVIYIGNNAPAFLSAFQDFGWTATI